MELPARGGGDSAFAAAHRVAAGGCAVAACGLGAEEHEHDGDEPNDKPVALLRRGWVGLLL